MAEKYLYLVGKSNPGCFDYFDTRLVKAFFGPDYSFLYIPSISYRSQMLMSVVFSLAKKDVGQPIMQVMDGQRNVTVTNTHSNGREWMIDYMRALCKRMCILDQASRNIAPFHWDFEE